ncbi:hypothetical protein FEM48_Zijuj05G0182900 [Ziziphus jujuba var. spinosa]|uniref:Fcf2 pre-rRNA processing C-terminal domain-containing protein n=1 Tax=Ziziphus jujuba var. spinosa TaxID=714518 RepID=A0A978VGD8_ZIZJJ|nr:hypothetical protein FEM48_Zijuj05G0182900 [Ziziphus jujuba var. spinosa]
MWVSTAFNLQRAVRKSTFIERNPIDALEMADPKLVHSLGTPKTQTLWFSLFYSKADSRSSDPSTAAHRRFLSSGARTSDPGHLSISGRRHPDISGFLVYRFIERQKEDSDRHIVGTKVAYFYFGNQNWLRNVMDPKRHYKKGDSKSTTEYFQASFHSHICILTKKERKATLADELLSDRTLGEYRKRKVGEIEEKNRPGGNEKWKIKGKHSQKRAKQRRH